MKKRMIAMAAASMLIGTGLTVMADASFEKVGSIKNADLIYDTNLLRVEGNDGYAMATLDGTLLTEAVYGSSFDTSKGYITASVNAEGMNRKGVFAQDGTELLPFQYGVVDVLNEHWILGIVIKDATSEQYDYTDWSDKDKYYMIETVDVYYIDGNVASLAASLPRENFFEADAYGKYVNIQDRKSNAINAYDGEFNVVSANLKNIYDTPYEYGEWITYKENGRQGIKDAEGNVIMEPSFQYIYSSYGGYAEVDNGENYGLVNVKTGEVAVPAEYEDILTSYYLPIEGSDSGSGYNAHGYFGVVKGGKVGFVTAGGNVTCEPKYSEDVVDNYGASLMLTDLEGKTHILSADGVETILEGYESIYALDYGAGMFYEVKDADYNAGMIDWHGNEIFGCEYSDIGLSADGKYLLVEIDYENTDIYAITYETTQTETEAATEATEQGSTEAENAESDNTAAIALIDSMNALLQKDAAANKTSVVTLLKNLVPMVESNAAVKTLVENALTLLDAEGGENNAEAIISLLESAKSLL